MADIEPIHTPSNASPIVFFDGDCGLCHAFVRWVARRDVHGVFWFAPLDGETAQRLRAQGPTWPETLDSVVIWTPTLAAGARAAWYTDGVFMVLARLPWPWPWVALARFVPRFIRDAVYRMVAKLRYRLFGRRDACDLSSQAAAGRLLL